MRISNEPGGPTGPTGAFAEMFRLQADFQARLAEETLRYLRRLQGAVVPASPGTVVVPTAETELRAAGAPGASATLTVEIENLQRVHCMVTPQLTPMVSAAGVTWFPSLESATASRLVAPGAVEQIALAVSVPAELPPDEYRGALLLQGFRSNSLPVVISVATEPGPSPKPPVKPPAGPGGPVVSKRAKRAARKRRSS